MSWFIHWDCEGEEERQLYFLAVVLADVKKQHGYDELKEKDIPKGPNIFKSLCVLTLKSERGMVVKEILWQSQKNKSKIKIVGYLSKFLISKYDYQV